uniref:Uncharacterized protein n=1 Tax=Oryza sativa subsp. japonica TaxID=39947 RepID=Q69L01_ORYSJ|nr:hypothetical protein [Oryza sativa Japonica Group]
MHIPNQTPNPQIKVTSQSTSQILKPIQSITKLYILVNHKIYIYKKRENKLQSRRHYYCYYSAHSQQRAPCNRTSRVRPSTARPHGAASVSRGGRRKGRRGRRGEGRRKGRRASVSRGERRKGRRGEGRRKGRKASISRGEEEGRGGSVWLRLWRRG